jgi:predicted kinase
MKINDLFTGNGFELNLDVIHNIPELNALKGCQQNQKFHQEGDAYVHTEMCVNAVYGYIKDMQMIGYDDMTIKCVITAVLFHDLGKPATYSVDGNGIHHAYGHEFASEKIARKLLWDESIRYREKVCGLVKNHMAALNIIGSKNVIEKIAALSLCRYFNMTELYYVKKADLAGTVNSFVPSDMEELEFYHNLTKSLKCEAFPCFGMSKDEYTDDRYTRYIRKLIFKEEYHKDEPTVWVHFMIGLPGSGKSTYVNEFLKTHPDAVVISRDMVRAELGFCEEGDKCVLDKEKEAEVSRACDSKLLKAVSQGKEVILDNMHTKKKYRDNVKDLLKSVFLKTNFRYEYTYCETTLENCMKCRPMISESVYKNMIESIDWPTPDEYHTFEIRYHL